MTAAGRAEWEDSRRLLQDIRMIAASALGVQERLDRIVTAIAAGMASEVCSIYVRGGEGKLVLTATEGLRSEAVHVTELAVGEGLVGLVAAEAAPVNLSEAASHENFAYRPETGEEAVHSFLGVPLLRTGRVVGVLIVQNAQPRLYSEPETETLQTVAMVVAEIAAAYEPPEAAESYRRPFRLEGRVLNAGLAVGTAFLHEPRLPVQAMVAANASDELARVDDALDRMHRTLDDRFRAADLAGEGEHRDVLNAFRLFAEDRGWLSRIRGAIQGGLSAEGAVARIQEDMRARMRQIPDPFFRERLQELDDLGNRLLHHLAGDIAAPVLDELPPDAVLIAHRMGAAELLDYPAERVRAVLLEEGSPTAHVTIVARALDIPMLGGIGDVVGMMEAGDRVAVDADNGQVFVRPGEEVEGNFLQSMAARDERRAGFAAMRDLPPTSRDGVEIDLNINAGLLIDIGQAANVGAVGVGLYRTEIPFMVRSRFPEVDDQERLYRRALDISEGRKLVFRTLDIGGDKVLPYWRLTEEGNPALGWRALRLALDRPFLLHQQLRAMIRAAAARDLHVMFPMVAEVAEFERAREIFDAEMNRERRSGRDLPVSVSVGAMIEVPALIWQLDALMRRADFVSVGSNDLLQFLFAADRDNQKVAARYDVLSPSVLAMAAHIVDAARRGACPLTFCGEMASRPLEAMALIGLGFRSLSVAPAAVGPVKAMLRSSDLVPLESYVRSLAGLPDRSVRGRLRAYAIDHGIPV